MASQVRASRRSKSLIATPETNTSCSFSPEFREAFRNLVLWRRDVRRFKLDPICPDLVLALIELASHAPSVGHSQPWRFVLVETPPIRAAVKSSFARANAKALAGYSGSRRECYARLKLAGLDAAPVQIAVFAEENTETGLGLGRQTMPETLRYSVVGALQILWLAARTEGLGIGWVSIIEPETIKQELSVPSSWAFVAYLCVGWPEEEHLDPELVRHGWQPRLDAAEIIFRR